MRIMRKGPKPSMGLGLFRVELLSYSSFFNVDYLGNFDVLSGELTALTAIESPLCNLLASRKDTALQGSEEFFEKNIGWLIYITYRFEKSFADIVSAASHSSFNNRFGLFLDSLEDLFPFIGHVSHLLYENPVSPKDNVRCFLF